MDQDSISKLRIGRQEEISPRKKGKRKLIWAVAILLCLLAAVFMGRREGWFTPTATVRISSSGWIYPSQVLTEFNASGYVVPQRKAAVASKGTGRLEYLGVQEGSRVKEGDILGRLESDDLRADKAQAEAQLNTARSDLVRAESEQKTAETNLKRNANLLKYKAVAQLDYENTIDRFDKAKASVASAKSNIRALEATVKKANVLIEYTLIKAPFDGVVLTKDADVGEVVAPFGSSTNAKAAIVTMADMSSLMVHADVAESFLSKVRMDQPCEIQLDSLPDVRFPGKVFTVVPTADRAKGTVLVKVSFDQLDPRILPEMSAKASFLSRPLTDQETRPFLAVHKDALVERDGTKGFFSVEADKVQWRPLPSPNIFGDYIVLGPEAKAGERIVLKPPSDLKTGDPVKAAE